MTEGAAEVKTSSTVFSDSKMMSEQTSSDNFRKPISLKNNKKKANVKLDTVNNKDSTHNELKRKKKRNKEKSNKKPNKGETEDATESVDSGCIADIAGDVTDWPQVETAVLEERNYVLSLLSWLPDFQWVLPKVRPPKPSSQVDDEPESKDDEQQKIKKKKKDPIGTQGKLQVFLNEADEIGDLREKYQSLLADLKKTKPKNSKKKESRLQKKLKNLNRRNKKNTNRQRKLEQAEIFKTKHTALEEKKGKQMKIFNERGKLVFSKFDFSSDGSGGQTKKAKNLEHKVAQAIKERERRKRLQKEGDIKAAAEVTDVQAWSSALKRAGGEKVLDDIGIMQKSIKKKEYRKKASKKRWEERTSALDLKMKAKQQKRQDNLKSRKEAKLQKKGIKMKKKGHIVPGF